MLPVWRWRGDFAMSDTPRPVGRPRLYEDNEVFRFRLPANLREALDAEAAERGVSRAVLVVELLSKSKAIKERLKG